MNPIHPHAGAATGTTLACVERFLDELLRVERERDPRGTGLLHAAGARVCRMGAALSTSMYAIEAAIEHGVDLLLVHHAPWPEIDLHLRPFKLARLSAYGISLYAAPDALAREPGLGVADSLARRVGVRVEGRLAGGEGVFGTAGAAALREWLVHVAVELATSVRAWPNSPGFGRVALVPGAGGATTYLAEAQEHGCDTFLTGEGSLFTELFARDAGISLAYATHQATEFPGICALTERVAAEFGLEWVALPEAAVVSGGGRAPLELG
ncbi:MAG TPA: Nif3-like dinuclear metal center hexameric protein [Longimicrobiaceae bacterium]|nr:Nif3-like dinuclear metal center hexameric protein [Longimicrobiaceae bacterium]